MLSVRQKVFFFVGLCLTLFGISLNVLGAWGTYYWVHGASGVVMWCGIFLIMCGVWNIVIAIDQDPKEATPGLSFSGLLVNMIAVFMGVIIIACSTWATWDILERGIIYGEPAVGGTEAQTELYVSVILIGVFAFILSLIALMADCCCGAFFEPGIPAPANGPGEFFGRQIAPAYPYPQRY